MGDRADFGWMALHTLKRIVEKVLTFADGSNNYFCRYFYRFLDYVYSRLQEIARYITNRSVCNSDASTCGTDRKAELLRR